MFDKEIIFHKTRSIDGLIKSLLGAVVISLLAPISIEVSTDIPITLQSMVILLWAVLWGFRIGTTATLLYILAGIVGLPVFPGYSSGFERIASEYGGFYFGFLAAAAIVGYLAEKTTRKKFLYNLALWLGGHMIILIPGFAWVWSLLGIPAPWHTDITPLLPGLMIKSALGVLVCHFVGLIHDRRAAMS